MLKYSAFETLKLTKSVWERVKGVLRKGMMEKQRNASGVKEWLEEINKLQLQVKELRVKNISCLDIFDLKANNANAPFYHIDRLLVKIREALLIFVCRRDQFSQEIEILQRKEFSQVEEACFHCYRTISTIHQLLKQTVTPASFQDLQHEVYILELESETLMEAIRVLNDFSNRREVAVQLLQLNQKESSTLKVQSLSNEEYSCFINRIIGVYEVLKSCYVVARRGTIKEDLDYMNKSIEMLIAALSESNKEDAVFYLHEIFNRIESLRFSTNKENRCSRYLFDKSKEARRKLRKACMECDVGQIFLKEMNFNKKMPA